MNKTFGDLSLRSKLLLSGLVPSVVVLLIAALSFAAYDFFAFRRSTLGNLKSSAHFIALTTRAAVQFGDSEYAAKILAGLAGNPDIGTACIYDNTQTPFARFNSAGFEGQTFPQIGKEQFPEAPPKRIWIFEPITLDGHQIGTVFIDAGYRRLWQRLSVVALGLVAWLCVLLLFAYGLSLRLQSHIARPLAGLASAARAISSDKDYSVRVERQPGPEFTALTDAFNHMLAQIQERDLELKKRADDLHRANQELEAFTYTVSHDLRSPLRSVAGFSHILKTQHTSGLDEEGATLVNRIKAGAERMGRLIDDLLAFSRLGSDPVSKGTVEPGEIARKVFEELRSHEGQREIHFTLEPLPKANADPALLEQVFTNLLSNALKYTRTQTLAEIHVGSTANESKTVYFVKDNGVGFDMRHAAQLFQVFHRLHKSKDFEGTGVGLAIVQRIVTRHGGRIWTEAERGRGATFYFTLD